MTSQPDLRQREARVNAALSLHIEQQPPGVIAELAQRLSALGELVPCPVELLDLVRSFPGSAAALDFDLLPAVGACEQRIVLKLSRRGFELLTALRALQVPGDLATESGHFQSPSLVDTAMVTESLPGQKPGGDEVDPSSSQFSRGGTT